MQVRMGNFCTDMLFPVVMDRILRNVKYNMRAFVILLIVEDNADLMGPIRADRHDLHAA